MATRIDLRFLATSDPLLVSILFETNRLFGHLFASSIDVSASTSEHPAKKSRTRASHSLRPTRGTYQRSLCIQHLCTVRCTRTLSWQYLASSSPNAIVKTILGNDQFKPVCRYVSSMYYVLATSAPLERIFSHGGIFVHPRGAHMSDGVLSENGVCKIQCSFVETLTPLNEHSLSDIL